jgi:hypothetical protein
LEAFYDATSRRSVASSRHTNERSKLAAARSPLGAATKTQTAYRSIVFFLQLDFNTFLFLKLFFALYFVRVCVCESDERADWRFANSAQMKHWFASES